MPTPKILLVDDIPMFLDTQKAFLRLSRVRTLTARDGNEAYAVVKEEHPDLIFMDLHMPGIDGATCCAKLKKDPLFKRIPIVMITSSDKSKDQQLCFAAGCNDFLTKPLNRALFLETARHYIPAIDRRERRVSCTSRVSFKAHGVTLSGIVQDLSVGGVSILADYELEVGSTIDLSFALPETAEAIEAKGRIAWLRRHLDNQQNSSLPSGFGVEFITIKKSSHSAIQSFVKTHSEQF